MQTVQIEHEDQNHVYGDLISEAEMNSNFICKAN